jgi:mono/diheme cytochrome c family protein
MERVTRMKRIVIALAAVAFATSAFAADGAATYASKCAACHGKAGEGAKMAPTPIAGMPAAQVEKAITEGKGKMKAVKIEDAKAVSEYVAGLKK